MHITFYGGVREVTGSMHLLAAGSDRILLDCGMYQGRRKETDQKNRTFPFDPKILTNIVLSHAHIDHSGRIPLIVKRNFSGRIVCTRATMAASEYLLADAAHIQESDALYLNYKNVRSLLYEMNTSPKTKTVSGSRIKSINRLLKSGSVPDSEKIDRLIEKYRLERIRPAYTVQDAEESLKLFDGYPYRFPIEVGRDLTCEFYDAGHILGSAITMIRGKENGRPLTVCYTGDLGRFEKPILNDPTMVFEKERLDIDLLMMESTYGNRIHEPVQDVRERLKRVLEETVQRGGSILIPAFAYGRTQELIYVLHELYDQGSVPKIPVYIDSPLAEKLTRVFAEHPEVYDEETHAAFLRNGKNPFSFGQIRFVSTVEESMALMREEKPHIVISASGMCEAGRILHHLRYKIHNPRHTILIVGFMAQHTLGRRIQELSDESAGERDGRPPNVRILGKEYPLRAKVVSLSGFSAHADKLEMLRFLKSSNLNIKRIAVVHGEEEQSLAFAEFLKSEGFRVFAPRAGETVDI